MKKMLASIIVAGLFLTMSVAATDEESVDLSAIARIKTEGLSSSQVMKISEMLTDVNGPRLSNSPGYTRAANWAKDKMTEWGLEAKLEPWGEFGRGWTVDYFHIYASEPEFIYIIAYPKAWIAGTNGEVSGSPQIIEFEKPEDLEKYRGKLKGAIVMTQGVKELDTVFDEEARRYSDEDLDARMKYQPRMRGGFDYSRYRAMRERRRKLSAFFKEEGVGVILEPSQWDEHNIRLGSGGSYAVDGEDGIPSMVVSAEHYNRIARMLRAGKEVKLNIKIDTTFYDEDTQGYNVIADIPGSDPALKDEVVIIGGHLDSWHAGTGAVDNASGCAVAMEAARLITELGLKPRRTIRVALWGGEEQGLHGSRGYVKKHYADPEKMELMPEHGKVTAYFNMDNGTGAFRGIHLQGNEALRSIFAAWMKPLKDVGMTHITFRNAGGTDHLAFDAVGIPGFQFIQDPISYMNRNHHASMDVYDQLVVEDMIKNSVIMAVFAYNAAMRDEMLPRKPLPEPQPRRRF